MRAYGLLAQGCLCIIAACCSVAMAESSGSSGLGLLTLEHFTQVCCFAAELCKAMSFSADYEHGHMHACTLPRVPSSLQPGAVGMHRVHVIHRQQPLQDGLVGSERCVIHLCRTNISTLSRTADAEK